MCNLPNIKKDVCLFAISFYFRNTLVSLALYMYLFSLDHMTMNVLSCFALENFHKFFKTFYLYISVYLYINQICGNRPKKN